MAEALEEKEDQSNWLQSTLSEPGRREVELWGRMKSGILMRGTKGFHVLKGNEDEWKENEKLSGRVM